MIYTLKRLWEGWRRIAHRIGLFQSRLLLTVFYFVLLPPLALIVRLFLDALSLTKANTGSYWRTRTTPPPELEVFRRQ